MRPEDAIQASIFSYLCAVLPNCFVHAIPNASRRSAGGSATNAVPGLVPGVPDLLCVEAGGGRVLYLEVKTPNGRLLPSQCDVLRRLDDLDIAYAIVRSVDDAREALARFRFVTRERQAA